MSYERDGYTYMWWDDLNEKQRLALAQCYLLKLADEGIYAEVMGVDWDAPSWGELANALDIVPIDVLEHEYEGISFVDEDFDFGEEVANGEAQAD